MTVDTKGSWFIKVCKGKKKLDVPSKHVCQDHSTAMRVKQINKLNELCFENKCFQTLERQIFFHGTPEGVHLIENKIIFYI